MTFNTPDLWGAFFPVPEQTGHKYNRGHAAIYGAPELTGATRLAAESAARIGAGLVTVIGGAKADIYRACLPAHILVRDQPPQAWDKVDSVLIGSGGLPADYALSQQNGKPVIVRDAEAIGAALDRDVDPVYPSLNDHVILTPHAGEFARAFPRLASMTDKAQQTAEAARLTGAVIVHKGPVTIIAHPAGRVVINDAPVPYLATAGTGDVLSGMIAGLTAQGMPPFEAACAAVYLHTDMGGVFGVGLVASDLPELIPAALKRLQAGGFSDN